MAKPKKAEAEEGKGALDKYFNGTTSKNAEKAPEEPSGP